MQWILRLKEEEVACPGRQVNDRVRKNKLIGYQASGKYFIRREGIQSINVINVVSNMTLTLLHYINITHFCKSVCVSFVCLSHAWAPVCVCRDKVTTSIFVQCFLCAGP